MKTIAVDTGSEVLEIDANTGEILVSADQQDFKQLQQTKIKALKLLSRSDFVQINGTWEAKRDGLMKILSSLPISYSWELKDRVLTESYSQVLGTLSIDNANTTRSADSIGTCELSELKGARSIHNMVAISETRALKRAIETLFGSVINYYVVNYLVGRA